MNVLIVKQKFCKPSSPIVSLFLLSLLSCYRNMKDDSGELIMYVKCIEGFEKSCFCRNGL